MLISLEWLAEYLAVPPDPDALAARLTLAGLEVERIATLGSDFEGIVVGEVTGLRPHPNANKLLLAAVSTGNAAVIEVVTGAPNLSLGDRVPLAPVGSRLGSRRITAETFRGIRSEGMLCSAAELGLGEDADGIFILDRAGSLGADLRQLYPPVTVLDLEIKSNRPDLLSHLGVAREVAALHRIPLRIPHPYTAAPKGATLARLVTLEDLQACRRFVGRLITDVHTGPSPAWMQQRLRAVGVRPISNVVDITNYVMLEGGQPMHAFDYARLQEGRLVVRRARTGEQLHALDGKTRALSPEFIVVADAGRPQAIAGIIGGAESAVDDATTSVLLEAATWDPARIRSTSRALGLRTEASLRFEKGLSPALSLPAVNRAAALLEELAGGKERGGADVYPDRLTSVAIDLKTATLDRILGLQVPVAEAAGILDRLGFSVKRSPGGLSATPPAFRLDCRIPEDLAEEVGRIVGYDQVPSTLPGQRSAVRDVFRPDGAEDLAREVLVGCGFEEAVTPSLVKREGVAPLRLPGAPMQLLGISNPLLENRDSLRASLLPGLLEALAFNIRQDQPGVRLFELGAGYWRDPSARPPQEPRLLALALHLESTNADVAARELRSLESALGLVRERIARRGTDYRQTQTEGFHPGRSALILDGDDPIGLVGEVHPEILARLELPGRALAAEVLFTRFVGTTSVVPQAAALPRFPAVIRDLTLVVRERIPARELVQVMRELGGYTLREISMQTEYVGPPLPSGARSLSFRLLYQAADRTLTKEDVQRVHDQMLKGLTQRFAVEVRA